MDIFEKLPKKPSEQQVKDYLIALAQSPRAFHLDDDPADIVYFGTPNEEEKADGLVAGQSVFTADQVDVLNHNMDVIADSSTGWEMAWEIYAKACQEKEMADGS